MGCKPLNLRKITLIQNLPLQEDRIKKLLVLLYLLQLLFLIQDQYHVPDRVGELAEDLGCLEELGLSAYLSPG